MSGIFMPCSHCGNEKIYAKGFCTRCYMRNLKNGSPDYVRNFIKTDDHCYVDDCHNPVRTKGLCEKHYMMKIRKGVVISEFGYGERQRHPLYHAWCYQIRVKEGRVKEWDDFWQFVADAGEKPSLEHKAKRHDIKQPWGPSNFYWKEITASTKDHANYQREWRRANPLKAKSYDLKRGYGIDLNEYMRMYDEQKGRCALCGIKKYEYVQTNKKGGEGGRHTLVVDHCHATGNKRKLLCAQCNKALGGFNDDVELLKKAIDYINQHATKN